MGYSLTPIMNPYIQKKVLQFESFVNDVLKEDLRKLDEKLGQLNSDMAEFLQLKTMISKIQLANQSSENSGFKTKLDIGNNFYVQAQVEDTSTILLDVGLGHFVEFTLDEAVLVINVRIKLLERQVENIRKETAKTKAHIKLILFSIKELQNIK
ncbi:protein UXT homolog [Athalia rosae]|uniref:protein UXT homolog n=1 Tax=Athalia rosae TaxID=37344 RepID=UPI0020346FF2|nr:protein UXT homolog [Athalia rosae]